MVRSVKYKGQPIKMEDIEVTWTDHFGEVMNGTIEDYGYSERADAWSECEAGEDW